MQGIRGFEPYLRERKLIQSAPLSSLSHTRLGIDASLYLRNLLSDPTAREPLVASTGGLPLALTARVENDLRTLERLNIRPVFVFAGLPTCTRAPPKGLDPGQERDRAVKAEAWGYYENGEVERAVLALSQVRGGAWTDARDVARLIMRTFKHRQVEYVVAPYLQFAQLTYLLQHQKGYIHAIYSSTECLLWPIDKLIISIDLSQSTFTFLEKPRILSDLALNEDQFLDLGLLAGCALTRTFPPASQDFTMRSIVDLVRHWKSGVAACQAWRADPSVKTQSYGDVFMRARLAVKYSLILTTEGACVPLPLAVPPVQAAISPADVPGDLDEIFSMRLPDELYCHICRGLVSPQVVGWLSGGQLAENQPLADSAEYRRFIKDVITEGATSPRCTTLALLADGLHPQWKTRRVTAQYYFDVVQIPPAGHFIPFSDKVTQSLVDKCSNWIVPAGIVENELRRQSSSTIDLKLCVGALATDELAALTRRGKNEKSHRPLDKKDEVVANVIWRLLDARGFIAANHTLSIMGKALHAACTHSHINDRFQEATYLVLELIRAGVVHGGPWGGPNGDILSGGPSIGSEEEQRSMLLIMRCLSVLQLNFRPQQWSGPLSRELLVFNSFVRALSKSLRHLLEALQVHILLSGDARRNREDQLDLMISVPFQTEPNTGFGILAKTYLDATIIYFGDTITLESVEKDSAGVKTAKKEALSFVEQSFSGVKGPVQEVERGFRFWDAIMVAIRTLAKEQGPSPSLTSTIISPANVEEFERADRWLKPMRP
ncbi:XPG domain-containing protein [Tremella mesenterica]|uniref:XPG domain-containing protein n=1 Tax=Tremella mesenterica TaxID=5217 RepID=A0A4Q1BMV5_TREME|nr:uncharacterized protein TREMEDRAFT_42554 [Tremella mesenterica DSM 1558]EIW71069.1 hypothetical protein TREMEDRAFT_42554 [Tremella mesenterica DSM 1558]RXK39175.1 XPG domain-containing protein [Tremella mesenterica]